MTEPRDAPSKDRRGGGIRTPGAMLRPLTTAGLFLAILAIMVVLALWILPGPLIPGAPSTTMQTVGVILTALGSALPVWAFLHFRRARTPVAPFSHPEALVTTGPYRWTRNPMYLGMQTALIGCAIAINSWSAILAAPLFAPAVARLVIRWEEKTLAARFGAAYRQYAESVPRWTGL